MRVCLETRKKTLDHCYVLAKSSIMCFCLGLGGKACQRPGVQQNISTLVSFLKGVCVVYVCVCVCVCCEVVESSSSPGGISHLHMTKLSLSRAVYALSAPATSAYLRQIQKDPCAIQQVFAGMDFSRLLSAVLSAAPCPDGSISWNEDQCATILQLQ